MKYAHTNIISNNWLRLANFYTKVFGCTVHGKCRNLRGQELALGTGVRNAEIQGVHLLMPGYGPDGPTLEIFQYKRNRDSPIRYANSTGLAHIAFVVNDLGRSSELAVRHGGTVLGKPIAQCIAEVGVCNFAYIRDPDKNIIEILNWS